MSDTAFHSVFFELHSGLPREGPGDDDSTLRALGACAELRARPDILDVGCGPGMQTLALLRATAGTMTATDLYQQFLDQLAENAHSSGVGERLRIVRADMNDLPFEADVFDLIWSEGAAYIMGIVAAYTKWRRFLRPHGYLVVSELTWLVEDVPEEVFRLFHDQYPGVTDIDGNVERIESCGYEIVHHFTLPEASWWTHYQTPLEAKFPALRRKYADDPAALAVIEEAATEHRISREHLGTYGYEFYIARALD